MRASGGLPARVQNSAGGATHRPPPHGIPGRVGRFSGASSGPLGPRAAAVPAPGSAPDGDPTHQGPGKPPDAFQPRITLPEHTNSPRQPKPKQTGGPHRQRGNQTPRAATNSNRPAAPSGGSGGSSPREELRAVGEA